MEQTFRRGHRQQRLNFSAAAGLTEDHYRARIAAEFSDIGPNPLQCMHNVQHPDITGTREVAAEFAEVGKTEHVEPMIDADHHYVAASREIGSIRVGRRTGTRGESAAVAPEHDGTFATVVYRRSPYVQHEAVFALVRKILRGDAQARRCLRVRITLRRAGTELQGVPNARPLDRIHRRHEAIFSRRAGTIRNTFECLNALVVDAANASEAGLRSHKPRILGSQCASGEYSGRSTPQKSAAIHHLLELRARFYH